MRKYPTQARLKELFDYNEQSWARAGEQFVGGLVWKPRFDRMGRPNTREVGAFAGCLRLNDRRLTVGIDGDMFELNRLTWVWHNGEVPTGMVVDHKSRDTRDGRIGNLRLGTISNNNSNRSKSEGTSSKYKGVYLNRRGKWIAQIKKDKRVTYLGSFDSELEAARARDEATKRMHGEFGVLNNA